MKIQAVSVPILGQSVIAGLIWSTVVAATIGCAPAQAQNPVGPRSASLATATTVPSTNPTGGSAAVSQDAGSQEADPPTLEVSGTGEVSVPADRARVSFAVESEGKTAGDAAQANANAMEAAMSALRGSRAEGLLIETHGYGLHPQYANRNEPNQAPRIVAYRAVNTISVTTTDVDAVGGLIDAATAAGVNRVASLQFDAQDTESARRDALAEAVRRARGEAEAIAGALGVSLGRVLQVRGGAEDPNGPPVAYARGMMMDAASTPTEAGAQTVRATVAITYALGSS